MIKRQYFFSVILGLSLFFLALTPALAAPAPPLSPPGPDARNPAITVSAGGAVHVVWEQDGGIWHSVRKTNDWSDPVQIVAVGQDPTLAAAPTGEIVYLAWSQTFDGNFEVFTSRWDGQSWSESQNVSSNDGGSATLAFAISATGGVHLFWSDTSPGSATIYQAQSSDGLTWPTALPIPDAEGANPTAAFAADGVLHLAWQYRVNFSERIRIWHSSYDGGWSAPAALTDGSQHALAPQLAAGPADLALTWQQGDNVVITKWQGSSFQFDRMEAGQQPALAFTQNHFTYWAWDNQTHLVARFRYAGWSEPITWALTASESGDIALAGYNSQIHLVWAELTGEGWRIFYDATTMANAYTPLILSAQ